MAASKYIQLGLMGIGALAVAQMLGGAVYNAAYSRVDWNVGRTRVDWANSGANGSLRVLVDCSITNRNPIAVTIRNVTGVVTYGNLTIANVAQTLGATLTPNTLKTITIVIDIPAASVVSDIVRNFQTAGAYATLVNRLNFKGVAYTDVINVPLDFPISLV